MPRNNEVQNFKLQEQMITSSKKFVASLCDEFKKNGYIQPSYYEKAGVKRGLRNEDGTRRHGRRYAHRQRRGLYNQGR